MELRSILLLALALCASATTEAQVAKREPVIDMHLHVLAPDAQGPPPLGMCTPR